MAKEFLLPELAESVVEGEIVKWLVAEGETVSRDQALLEVMTDKVTVELPSPYAGVLEKQLVREGDVVPVNTPLARISGDAPEKVPSLQADEERSIVEPGKADEEDSAEEDDGEALSLFKPSAATSDEPLLQVRGPKAVSASAATAVATKAAPGVAPSKRATGPFGRVLAVPAARKLARELDLDIGEVPGSGPNGRVRVADVKAYAEKSGAPASQVSVGRTTYATPEAYGDLEERIPVRGLRRAISSQMVASHLQTVRTLHVDEADVSALVALRERLKPLALERGAKLSYLPFIMKAVVAALRRFPTLNASLDEDAGDIVQKRYYNLGMAVATDAGLVVPVVHGVAEKGLLELAADISDLAAKARDGKLAPENVKHGTFSVTNIGTLGGLFSFPIINVPEAAILGVHSIKKRPVVLPDDSVVARQMLYLSLSFDHRIVDGAEAAMFTSYLIKLLETPESLMLEP